MTDKLVQRRRGGYRYEQNVGFGGQTPPSPIRLQTGDVQQTTREPYRLRTRGDVLVLQSEIRGEWQALYEFATRTVPAIDLKVGSWYVSTHPSSIFVTSLMVSLIVADGRCNLDGRDLTYHRDGGTEKVRLDDATPVVDALIERFGIDVTDVGEREVLEARIDGLMQGGQPGLDAS